MSFLALICNHSTEFVEFSTRKWIESILDSQNLKVGKPASCNILIPFITYLPISHLAFA